MMAPVPVTVNVNVLMIKMFYYIGKTKFHHWNGRRRDRWLGQYGQTGAGLCWLWRIRRSNALHRRELGAFF